MKIIKASANDAHVVAKLSCMLWPGHSVEEMTDEFCVLLSQENAAVYLAVDDTAVGFAQCQLRCDYVEGTDSSPVGYLEGIFVLDDYRRRGVARALLTACQQWAKDRGCSEFASDCEIDNTESLVFHLAMGFVEANRIICFAKKLQ